MDKSSNRKRCSGCNRKPENAYFRSIFVICRRRIRAVGIEYSKRPLQHARRRRSEPGAQVPRAPPFTPLHGTVAHGTESVRNRFPREANGEPPTGDGGLTLDEFGHAEFTGVHAANASNRSLSTLTSHHKHRHWQRGARRASALAGWGKSESASQPVTGWRRAGNNAYESRDEDEKPIKPATGLAMRDQSRAGPGPGGRPGGTRDRGGTAGPELLPVVRGRRKRPLRAGGGRSVAPRPC